jgi:predicted nucleic acid-binding protein
MKDLLDTNIVSELSKPKPHGGVLASFHSLSPGDYALPSVVLYELQDGIERARIQHPARAAELDRWTDILIQTVPILSLDGAAARETARLIQGKSMNLLEDAMIAAIAKVNGLRIATRNEKDFVRFGVSLVNPFLYRKP